MAPHEHHWPRALTPFLGATHSCPHPARQLLLVSPRATTLVTHGLYSRIRNPIYVFGLLLIAGLILYLDHPRLLLILLPVIPLQIIRARRESQVLQAHFGDAYRQYKSNTWF